MSGSPYPYLDPILTQNQYLPYTHSPWSQSLVPPYPSPSPWSLQEPSRLLKLPRHPLKLPRHPFKLPRIMRLLQHLPNLPLRWRDCSHCSSGSGLLSYLSLPHFLSFLLNYSFILLHQQESDSKKKNIKSFQSEHIIRTFSI